SLDNQQWQVAKKVAATYIGTVVGAGFATGREIVDCPCYPSFYYDELDLLLCICRSLDNQQWQVAKKVAATYIGTVVGAG
ncbi:hypothetical protein ACT453_57620, partial [Bacillus sp. D-CC]